jgi:hypothetical protein
LFGGVVVFHLHDDGRWRQGQDRRRCCPVRCSVFGILVRRPPHDGRPSPVVVTVQPQSNHKPFQSAVRTQPAVKITLPTVLSTRSIWQQRYAPFVGSSFDRTNRCRNRRAVRYRQSTGTVQRYKPTLFPNVDCLYQDWHNGTRVTHMPSPDGSTAATRPSP